MWGSLQFGSFLFLSSLLLLDLLFFLFFQFIFPWFFHFCHCSLISLQLFFHQQHLFLSLFILFGHNLSWSSCIGQLFLQPVIFSFELSYKLVLRIFIYNSFIFDLFCSISIFQCINSLIKIFCTRSYSTNHVSLGITSKSILKHSSEARISIWDNHRLFTILFVDKSFDYVT